MNIVLNGKREARMNDALEKLLSIESKARVIGYCGSITETDNIKVLIDKAVSEFSSLLDCLSSVF